MQSIGQDLRHSVRMLLKTPGLALVAVLTLGLGIGANTAIFTVVNAVLYRPLPYPNEERLVVVQQTRIDQPGEPQGASYLNFLDWRERTTTFERLAIVSQDEATLKGEGEPVRIKGAIVSADLFQTLGVAPALGRAFDRDDERPGAAAGFSAVMLSDGAWRNRFGGDPKIVGRKLTLEDRAFTVIGVAPAGLLPLEKEPIEYWTTTAVNGDAGAPGTANASRGYTAYLGVIGRMKPGVRIEQARAELETLTRAMREEHPESNARLGVRAVPLRDFMIADAGSMLLLLQGIVGVVLLIACVNVANLLLARATTQRREIAIRMALGASARRIVRRQIGDGVLLAIAGGIAGLLLSMWLIDALISVAPADIPRITGLAPDWRVFGFTLIASVVTGVVCSLAPAFASLRINLQEAVNDGGRNTNLSPKGARARNALLVVQLSASVILLIGAGLLINSFIQLQRVNPGFSTGNILTLQMTLSSDRYLDRKMRPERINAFLDEASSRIKGMPGVRSVSYAQCVPLTSIENNTQFDIDGRPTPKGRQAAAQLRFIGLDYLQTLSIPLLQGRDFTRLDGPQSPAVVIINDAFAQQYFQAENPIGKKLKLGWGGDEPKEIVGVIGNVRHRSLSDGARPEMYVPQAQFANAGITMLARTEGSPESLIGPIKKLISELDPELPVTEIKTLDEFRLDSLAGPRFNTLLLGSFAGLALILTLIGLYGVVSYSVAQRKSEIGVRLALGAQGKDILLLVVGEGMRIALLGVMIGAIIAKFVTRLLKGLLFGVAADDPLTFLMVAFVLLIVTLIACWAPARRASRVDPMIALRQD